MQSHHKSSYKHRHQASQHQLQCSTAAIPFHVFVRKYNSVKRIPGLATASTLLIAHLSVFALQARVEAAGGQILFWNGVRVMGVLAVSRAIGDHCLRPFVIAQPEVKPDCGSYSSCKVLESHNNCANVMDCSD